MSELISRKAAIDAVKKIAPVNTEYDCTLLDILDVRYVLTELPSAESEKEIPRRVLWSGWKGTRYTRYRCPNCNKPVKNDDVYCHRCGQKLMFPKISFTDYVPGEKQDVIVRWDDEE